MFPVPIAGGTVFFQNRVCFVQRIGLWHWQAFGKMSGRLDMGGALTRFSGIGFLGTRFSIVLRHIFDFPHI